jgi:hypothetical protein
MGFNRLPGEQPKWWQSVLALAAYCLFYLFCAYAVYWYATVGFWDAIKPALSEARGEE